MQGADGYADRQSQTMDADRLFATAIAKHQAGDFEGSIALYRRVVALRPEAGAPLINMGMAWQGLGHHDFALAAYRQALCLEPANAAAWGAGGGALLDAGLAVSAIEYLGRSVRLDPHGVQAYNNLGNALAGQGRTREASHVLRLAVALSPDSPQPYNNLGAVLIEAGAIAEGFVACAHALTLRPDNPEGENNLGNALMEMGRTSEATAAFLRALALHPDFPEACTNLSGALIDNGACLDAVLVCRRAIMLQPGDAKAYNNLGNALRGEGKLEEAAKAFRDALRIAPKDAEIHYNASAVLLKLGRLPEGLAEFEWRKQKQRNLLCNNPLPGPEWDGRALDGRTLLLYAEQGYGDVLQFVRYAPILAMQVKGTVLLRVYPPLVKLLSGLPGIEAVLSTDDPLPDFDCHLPLMSLPFRLGTVLETIPATVPYLSSDSMQTQRWQDRLSGLAGYKVGLVWAGDPRLDERGPHLMDQRRSLALTAFDEILGVPGVQWVSLQKGVAANQARELQRGTNFFDPMDEISDFADTAALVAGLDLVISVDTAVAHLAGALGKPVWILSRFDGCWRWLEERTDSPWYPSARIYRQAAWGGWTSVLAQLAVDLREVVVNSRHYPFDEDERLHYLPPL
jgi:tetratricopeptide (TPR) repeat protein